MRDRDPFADDRSAADVGAAGSAAAALGSVDLAAEIAARRDGRAVQSIELLGEGDFHVAYLVDGEWVFRFPKHGDATTSLRREACLLPALARRLPLAVPQPELVQLDGDLPFVAHRLVPGLELTRERYLDLAPEQRDRCAAQIAAFVAALHATDLDIARRCSIEVRDHRAHYAGLLRDAQSQLWPHLSAPEREFVEAQVGEYLSSSAVGEAAVLLHGDLSPEHVMHDPGTHTVTGIIDFGDVVVGDPAWDLVYLYEDYGLDLLARFLRHHADPDPASLLRRVHRFWVLDLVEWALRCVNDDSADRDEATELDEAIAQLGVARRNAHRSLDELLATCLDS